jgi:hypothetical protein
MNSSAKVLIVSLDVFNALDPLHQELGKLLEKKGLVKIIDDAPKGGNA